MANFELRGIPVPSTSIEAERIERWLENAASGGANLVCFMPSTHSNQVVAVFRVQERGRIGDPT